MLKIINCQGTHVMTNKIIYITLVLFAFSAPSFSAPSGGSAGPSNDSYNSQPRKSKEQIAVERYQKGLKARDRAWKYEEQALTESNEKKQQKLLKKAQKQYKTAQKNYKRALKTIANAYEIHTDLGYAYRKTGEYDLSLASYDEALRLQPAYTEAIEYRGEAFLGLNRLDDVKTSYMVLFRNDREKADILMKAIQQWIATAADNNDVSEAAKSEFSAWASERIQLNQQSLDLSPEATNPWNAAT
ncbi:hypothetical protein NBRC116493_01360 [Aurantivibrio infirmus]